MIGSQTATTDAVATVHDYAHVVAYCRHVVERWRPARGTNQHRTRWEANCVYCGERIVRPGKRETER